MGYLPEKHLITYHVIEITAFNQDWCIVHVCIAKAGSNVKSPRKNAIIWQYCWQNGLVNKYTLGKE